jgi:hypothetical protein
VSRPVLLAALPVAAVALFAGVISYTHVYSLAVRTDQGDVAAHLLPLSLDGLIVAGSAVLLAGSRLGWLGIIPGVIGTLFANIVSMLPHGRLSATVASWPAIAFTVASFMLERWLRSQVGQEVAQCVTSGAGPGPELVTHRVVTEVPADPDPVPAALNGHGTSWSPSPSGGWS